MEEMLRKETISHRNQGNTVIIKGGNPKPQSKLSKSYPRISGGWAQEEKWNWSDI
jgi:hypothetical protein